MDNPRPDKVAVVDEVRRRFQDSGAAILTEYRGLKVQELAGLRRSLTPLGGDYKIYKNTLVRLATAGTDLAQLHDLLIGPTAIAFVSGDAAAVAKALRDYARANPNLVIKGGVLDGQVIGVPETTALAELPPRDQLLAQLAGALAAPLRQLAGLMQALPRDLLYGLAALKGKLEEAQGEVVAEPTPAGDPAGETAAEAEGAEPAESATSESPDASIEQPAGEDSADQPPTTETTEE